jgi:hypothetical protein
MREDYGQLWNMGRANCWSWEVEEERERERESSGTQSQWPCDACKERQGNNAAASAGRSRRTKPPPTAIPRMSQAACIQTYIQFLSRFSGRSRTLLHSLSGQSLSIVQPSHGLSSLERSHRNRDPSQPSIQQQRKFGESFERRVAQSPASRGPSIHFRKKRDEAIES